MSDDFYRRLDEKQEKDRIERIFKDRPENLHDYQGCENDPVHLRQRIADLESLVERLSAPVSDEDWEAVRRQVADEKHNSVSPSLRFVRITGAEVFNKIITTRKDSK